MSSTSLRRTVLALTAALALSPFLDTSAADIKERKVKFSYVNAKGHPQDQGAAKFAELVAARSGGRIKVATYPGGVLGGDLQTVSALQGGTIEMTVLNAGLLATQVKEMAVFDLPFLFANAEEADAIADGPLGQALLARLTDKGLVGLGYWDLGFRNLTNSKRPVTRLEDIAGLKIRVVQSPIYVDLFSALGANATPMPFPEVYTALEQKAIDGQENPVTLIRTSKFNEVQKHLALTRHTFNPQVLLVSRKFWDGLSPDERKLFSEAAAEATAYQRKVNRTFDAESLAELKKAGMQVTEIAPAELARLRDKVRPVVDKHSAKIGAETVQAVMAELAKLRKGAPAK